VDGRIILKLKLKELVLNVLTGCFWIGMLVAGRLCNRVVERYAHCQQRMSCSAEGL
jgi:hypothetical protein